MNYSELQYIVSKVYSEEWSLAYKKIRQQSSWEESLKAVVEQLKKEEYDEVKLLIFISRFEEEQEKRKFERKMYLIRQGTASIGVFLLIMFSFFLLLTIPMEIWENVRSYFGDPGFTWQWSITLIFVGVVLVYIGKER